MYIKRMSTIRLTGTSCEVTPRESPTVLMAEMLSKAVSTKLKF